MIKNYQVKLLSNLAALDAIKEAWQELYETVPENTGFYSSYAYLRPYLEFHQPSNWTVVAIYNDDSTHLVGIFPLSFFTIQDNGISYNACKPLATAYAGYFDFAVFSRVRRQVLGVLLNTVLRDHFKCDVAFLGPLHESSPLAPVLMQDLDAQTLKMISNNDALSQIDTRGQSLDAYFSRKKSLTLRDAHYQERRLRRHGEVRICLSERGQDVGPVVLELCRRNEENFPDVNYYRQHPQWKEYMALTATELTPQGRVEIGTLRFNERVIASTLSFVHPGRRYFYLTAYDPEFARYSPSKILLGKMVENAFVEKSVFCFGAGSYPYKEDWSQSIGDLRYPIIFFNPPARQALDDKVTLDKLARFLRHH